MVDERVLAFLERDRVDNRPALHAFQSRLDHLPFRRVDHQGNARDIGFGSDQVQKARHRRFRIEHRFVHVDVDHLRAVLHLRARDLDRAGEIAGKDQPGKRPGTGDVRTLADVDEQRVVTDRERLQAGETHHVGHVRSGPCGAHGAGPNQATALSASTGSARGGRSRTASAIARICAGFVPQQPPTMLTNPLCAKSFSIRDVCAGVSS